MCLHVQPLVSLQHHSSEVEHNCSHVCHVHGKPRWSQQQPLSLEQGVEGLDQVVRSVAGDDQDWDGGLQCGWVALHLPLTACRRVL